MIGKALGVNAFPEWLPRDVVQKSVNLLQEKYNALYQGGIVKHENWKEQVKSGGIPNPVFAHIIFTLALYDAYLKPTGESQMLVEKAYRGY
jgi:hypothetical protein